MNNVSALFFCGLFLCTNVTNYAGDMQSQKETQATVDVVRLKTIFDDMNAIIIKETSELGKKHWAGNYTSGGLGLTEHGPVISLALAPKSGFVCTSYMAPGQPHFMFFGYGKIRQEKGAVVLTFTSQHQETPSSLHDGKLHPVKWGERRYLIPGKDLVNFCNAVNSWEVPRFDDASNFLLRDGDGNKKVHGVPSVPRKYRKYLLIKPLVSRVIGVGTSLGTGKCNEAYQGDTMTINVGKKHGVFPGMPLYIRNIDDLVSRVVVLALHEDTCKVGFFPFVQDQTLPSPKIGWKLSSVSFMGVLENKRAETFLKKRAIEPSQD